MKGIHYVTDEKNRKVAVQLDLKEHGKLWEDVYDIIIAESRKGEKTISLSRLKKDLREKSEVSYSVSISDSAAKELKRLPKKEAKQIIDKLTDLEDNARPPGCVKLEGSDENMWRIRSGDYRAIYVIDDRAKLIDVRRVRHRGKAYE